MPPDRTGRTAVLLLVAALLLAAVAPIVSAAGGPPEHANPSQKGIESAGKNPNDDKNPDPGQNQEGGAPEETPTPDATPTHEETPTAGAAPGESEPVDTDPFPWLGVALTLALLGGGAVGARYLMRPDGGDGEGAATVLADAYRTVFSRATGFPPELAERYDQVALVGRGGLGQVFSAVRRDDRRTVAVKIPTAYDEATGKTFMKEMRFWEDLTHPNIVAVHSVNILPVPFVEMEYLPRTLGDLEKPLPAEIAARIAAGIAAGIAYAHGKGVIHRDIKPGNILLSDDLTPKITDWGTSTTVAESRDTGVAGFTLAYAAPEQIAPERFGRADARTDIYQLGAVFYELVTGKPPNARESLAGLAEAVIHEQPAPPSELDPDLAGLDPIILRCLAKDPADRYRSAGELLEAIEALAGDAGVRRP